MNDIDINLYYNRYRLDALERVLHSQGKSIEDAVYPMLVAVVFAFLCAAGGTWLFGVKLGWLAVGAYVGMALDECVRAVFLYLRWRRGCWRTIGLTTRK